MSTRILLKLVAAFLVGACVLFAGFVWGFVVGYGDNAASQASVQSFTTVSALRALRGGKLDDAIQSLETALDVALIQYWVNEDSLRPTRLLTAPDTERKLLLPAAKYRQEFPSQSLNAEAKAKVNEIAASYK
jgi:hypothetical protein